MRAARGAGAGGNVLVGTATAIADQLQALSASRARCCPSSGDAGCEAGLNGVLCTWVDFVDGLERQPFDPARAVQCEAGQSDR